MPTVPERKTTKAYGRLYTSVPSQRAEPSQVPAKMEKIANDIYERQVERVNKIAVLDAVNTMSSYDRELLRNPDTGALNMLGKSAIAGFKDHVDKRKAYMSEIRNGLTQSQQDAFDIRSSPATQAFRQTLDIHQAKQTLVFENEVYKTSHDRILQDVGDNYKDADRLELLKREAAVGIAENAQANDRGADWVDLAVRNTISDIHKKVVKQYTADGDHAGALAYANENEKEKEMFDDEELKAKLAVNASRSKGNLAAQNVWEDAVPSNPFEPIEPNAMYKALRGSIDKSKDPEAYKAAKADLQERLLAWNAQIQFLQTKRFTTLDGMYKDGMSLKQVQDTSVYQSMNATERKKFDEYWGNSKEADSGGKRVTPTQAQKTAAHMLVGDDEYMYAVTEEELYAKAPELTDEMARWTVDHKRNLMKFDRSKVNMLRKEFDAIMLKYGFNTGKLRQTDDEKQENTRLWTDVMSVLAQDQEIKTTKLTKLEMQEIIKTEMSAKVGVKVSAYWGLSSDVENHPYFLLSDTEKENVKVPDNFRTAIYNWFVTEQGRRPTDAETRNKYLSILEGQKRKRLGAKLKVPGNE